jgi:uncharacterized membrane protein
MKWKNYGLWVSIASLLYMIFKDLGLQIDLTAWQTYVTAILGILVSLGIISNPESGKGYLNAKIPPTTPENSTTEQPNIITGVKEAYKETDSLLYKTKDTPLFNPDEEIVPDRRHMPNEK